MESENNSGNAILEDLILSDIIVLIDQHILYLKCLKEYDMYSDEKKNEIVGKIDGVFEIINGRSGS